MKKYLFIILLVGVCFSQNNDLFEGITIVEEYSDYRKAQNIVSTIEKLFELNNKKEDINRILMMNNNILVLEQLEHLSVNFESLFNNITDMRAMIEFHKIIANCGGDNSFTDAKIKIYLDSVSFHIKRENKMNNYRKKLTQDSGILNWYNNYLQYVSDIETLL
tara:strand:- start:513 stop:1001 length:489 start_codon:yes stop_codon:yes gene_type:complete